MARVAFGARALADLERLADFAARDDPLAGGSALESILDAVATLQRHPLIGRPVEGQLRELVVSYGHSGYVALYRFRPVLDRVEVLAIRHQREAGFG